MLGLAILWLLSRVVFHLDFADEMQYYCEIASLVRTGKLFHDDLFIQQLGYVLVFPFFKLHALFFPDQSYLVVFGRILLAAAYGVVGLSFWRSTAFGSFGLPARIAALATFVAWIPFQIFAFSYNTFGYLLTVAALMSWLNRKHGYGRQQRVLLALLLTALGFGYPPAGAALLVIFAIMSAREFGPRAAYELVGFTAMAAVVLATSTAAFHGPDIFEDLAASFHFSRVYSVGETFRKPDHFAGLLLLLAISGLAYWRLRRGEDFVAPLAANAPTEHRKRVIILLALTGAALAALSVYWHESYFPTAALLCTLVILTIFVGAGGSQAAGDARALRLRQLLHTILPVAGALIVLLPGLTLPTGYFGAALFLLVVILLVRLQVYVRPIIELVGLGAALGAIYAVSSGNGVHNFGIGAMCVVPFLVLHCAEALSRNVAVGRQAGLARLLPPLCAAALLGNGMLNPYREEGGFTGLERVTDVPAFAGIRTSPVKLRAIKLVRQLTSRPELAGKRLLVAGPHPWIYFASTARPTTPMAFMHFSGGPAADQMLADRLFLRGKPDAILITNLVPAPVQTKIRQWIQEGCVADKVALPTGFPLLYWAVVRSAIQDELVLLRREFQ